MPRQPINPGAPEDEQFESHDISKKLKKEKPAEKGTDLVKDAKSFFIILGVIILFFVVLMGSQIFVDRTPTKSIDELHSENLEGNLDPEVGYLYNGFSFVKVDNQWWTRFQRADSTEVFNVQLRYGPRELEDIPILGDYVYFLRFNASFVSFDPLGENLSHTALAAADVSQAMVRVFNIATFPACSRQDNETCADLPILECTPGKPVVLIQEDSKPFVEVKGTCITIHGRGMGMVKAVDRLLLGWYGIMP